MTELPELFPGFESRRFTTRGAEIFARLGGEGPLLFLLHGYPQTHAIWHRVAPLIGHKFRLVLCDLRGYGASSLPPTDAEHFTYSKRSMALDVIDIADQLGAERFFLCGHDRGGRVGYRLALDHPARIEKLIALDIIPTYEMWHRLTADLAMKIFHWPFLAQPAPFPEDMIGADPDYWLDSKMLLHGGSGDQSIFAPEALAHYRHYFRDPAHIHASCEDYRAGVTCDLAADTTDREAGRRIACPTGVFWGARGIPSRSTATLDIWQAWCEDVRGNAIECGHYLPEEAPQETASAILEFFGAGD
jgi:haloacetate dehalogenase